MLECSRSLCLGWACFHVAMFSLFLGLLERTSDLTGCFTVVLISFLRLPTPHPNHHIKASPLPQEWDFISALEPSGGKAGWQTSQTLQTLLSLWTRILSRLSLFKLDFLILSTLNFYSGVGGNGFGLCRVRFIVENISEYPESRGARC